MVVGIQVLKIPQYGLILRMGEDFQEIAFGLEEIRSAVQAVSPRSLAEADLRSSFLPSPLAFYDILVQRLLLHFSRSSLLVN